MEAEKSEAKDDHGAFVQKFELRPPPDRRPPLPLHGLTFAVKDIFDISGYVTGFGNPDWARTHEAATSTSPVVLAVLEAGAVCVGKTVMDELAYSINGENYHYGTPKNPCAPDRVPGGSSSGSAVAVAAGLADFSLGTDTGGSVRVPSSYCGIFGFRPSHGTVSTAQVISMAQSFDTVGWFARNASTLNTVGHVLLQSSANATVPPTCFVIPEDCFELLGSPSDQTLEIVKRTIEKTFGSTVIKQENLGEYIYQHAPSLERFLCSISKTPASTIPILAALSVAMRTLQRFEFKKNHGEWLNAAKPSLGPGIAERVSEALAATDEDVGFCCDVKDELRAALSTLLEEYGVLALPTVPGPPPKLRMDARLLEDFRAKAFSLLSIAGMSGVCQVTVPLGMHDNLPVSVSFLARHGADSFLLNVAEVLHGTLKEEAKIVWESRV